MTHQQARDAVLFTITSKDKLDLIDAIYDMFQSQFENVTRVEVITSEGRECTKYTSTKFKLSLQDNNQTLKLFEES